MRYSFEFTIDSKDYLDFNIHTLKVYGLLKKQSISLRILLLAVMLIYIVIEVVNSAELSEKIISVIAIVFVFSIAQLLVSPVLMLCMKSAAKAYVKGGKKPFSSSMHLEFYDEYIVDIDDSVKTELKYSAIDRLSCSESKTLYLHIDKSKGYFIPRSAFGRDEEVVEFMKFIREKCTSAECLF